MARETLAPSFLAVPDANALNEVVCPLQNQDGTNCRKRCHGEKRYRSMQEHIRRAHPDHYIPKLPATEESFKLMISSRSNSDHARLGPPFSASKTTADQQQLTISVQQNPPQTSYSSHHQLQNRHHPHSDFGLKSSPETPVRVLHQPLAEIQNYSNGHQYMHPPNGQIHHYGSSTASSAAAALTQLHRGEPVREFYTPSHPSHRQSVQASYPPSVEHSPSRSSTLPPITSIPFRPVKSTPRSARQSPPSYNVLKPHHERRLSKDHSNHTRRLSYDRKTQGAEAEKYGKRWEDLIDAAANATQVTSQPAQSYQADSLPPRICHSYAPSTITSPHISPPLHLKADRDRDRHSLPPSLASSFRMPPPHTASPLARQVTPPRSNATQPFPSIDRAIQFPPLPTFDKSEESPRGAAFTRLTATGSRPRSATTQATLQRNIFMNSIPEKESTDSLDGRKSGESKPISGRPAASSFSNSTPTGRSLLSPSRSTVPFYGVAPDSQSGPYAPAPFNSPSNGTLQLQKGVENRPVLPPPQALPGRTVEMRCFSCARFAPAAAGFACAECITGFCTGCVERLTTAGQGAKSGNGSSGQCPSCGHAEASFKQVQLELR